MIYPRGIANDTVTFVSFTEGAGPPDVLGIKPDEPHEVDVANCRFRPLNASETPQAEIDIATQLWRCHAPADNPAALNAQVNGYLKFRGDTFSIIGGPQLYTDAWGRPTVVVIDAQRQEA